MASTHPVKDWSTTPASNTTTFEEGMTPSSVNDDARDLLAAVREFYEDMEWRDWGHTPTRTSNTTFTVATDVTSIYHAGRRIKATDSSTLYGTIDSSSFSSPNTTVTVTLDSGNLSASLTAVALGFAADQASINSGAIKAFVEDYSSYIQNLGLEGTVDSNNLTVAVKGQDLNDPSASNEVKIYFRNATATTGDYVERSVTSALSAVLDAGGTLGFTSSEDGYIYIYAIDNAGTVELALARKALFDESVTHSTTALSSASDSDTVLYSESARTDVAVRLIGRLRIETSSTAGNWDSAPSAITVWNPTMKKTGDVIQKVVNQTGAVATGTTVFPDDDTIPQNTEGDEYMTQAITPTSSINDLKIDVKFFGAASTGQNISAALFQDSTANALAAGFMGLGGAANRGLLIPFTHWMKTGTTSSTTFKVRAGIDQAGTTTFNGQSGGRIFGGVMASSLIIQEIQA